MREQDEFYLNWFCQPTWRQQNMERARENESHEFRILDRKLFADGGYYLSNGAAVCEPCHLLCEYTLISVEQVRALAKISDPMLPPDMSHDDAYDKWGNRIWPSGCRSKGPLGEDDGMRKALIGGKCLGLLMSSAYQE